MSAPAYVDHLPGRNGGGTSPAAQANSEKVSRTKCAGMLILKHGRVVRGWGGLGLRLDFSDRSFSVVRVFCNSPGSSGPARVRERRVRRLEPRQERKGTVTPHIGSHLRNLVACSETEDSAMQSFSRLGVTVAWAMAGILSIRVAAACSCVPQPILRIPSLRGKNVAVFVGVIDEVFPKDRSECAARYQEISHERLSGDTPPSPGLLRMFVLQFWPTLFSPIERERIQAAKSLSELESAVAPFWLTPRRIRLKIEEPFAGPLVGTFVLYTGLGGGDCGVGFRVGERWLVDAYLDEAGRWIAHLCSVTLPVADASAVLTRLRAKRR